MADYKPLSELTLMDDYMFSVVMREPNRIRRLIESILGIRIDSVRFLETQRTIKDDYVAKGVKLDLFVEAVGGALFNVEVQTAREGNLPRRMRYYQSLIDQSDLKRGQDYVKLRDSYVIFICSFDPFRLGNTLYTFEYRCREHPDLLLGDGATKVVVNTKGFTENLSPELQEIIDFLERGQIGGAYSKELDEAIQFIKSSEERKLEYMTLEARYMDKMREGKRIGIQQGEQKGIKETTEEHLRQLMTNLQLPLGKAMDALSIPEAERPMYYEIFAEQPQ